MNIDLIRSNIEMIKGRDYNFRFNGNRNQVEEFNGVVISTYPAIFLIRDLDAKKIRSFSYNDVITSSLEIIDVKRH